MIPIIMHLDMNSYFASVEQQETKAWRGKPVGVCEHLGGIIIGASVEAKKWGITTGTPVWEARKLYPKIILTHTHPDRYRHYTKQMIKVVSDYTDKVEVYSIDEVFADLTKVCNVRNIMDCHSERPLSASEAGAEESLNHCFIDNLDIRDPSARRRMHSSSVGMTKIESVDPFEEAVKIAREIKKRITAEVGDWLRCSIGIAENKLQAKIASDMKKPDGLTVIFPDGYCRGGFETRPYRADYITLSKGDLYRHLKLTDVPGIGRRMEKRLNELGIKSLTGLKNYPKSRLVALFGIPGHHLYNLGQLEGSFKPEVEEDENIKSIGHMYTLPQQFRDKKYFMPVLYKLSEMVARRLRNQELMGNVLFVSVYGGKDKWFGRSHRLKYYLWDGREIFAESVKILESASEIFATGAKLIGVGVAGLREFICQQSLFGSVERQRRLTFALDSINDKYGDFTVCRVPVLKAGKVIRDSVGFGRIRELNKIDQN